MELQYPKTIAANPYQKEESNNDSKTNNLEKLNRTKRQVTPVPSSNYNFLQNLPELSISNSQSKNDMKNYFANLVNNFIPSLRNNDIIRIISQRIVSNNITNKIEDEFFINSNSNYQYFVMTINVENKKIWLVFRSSDFYLQGFIINNDENITTPVYYHFNDNDILRNFPNTVTSTDTEENNIQFGSNYQGSNNLNASQTAPIRWSNIVDAFQQLINYGENPRSVDSRTLRAAFVRVILATAESLRFRSVRNQIVLNYNNDTENSSWGWYYNNYLNNWDSITNNANRYLNRGTLVGFCHLNNVSIFSKNLSPNFKTCGLQNRQKRNLNNNEYCASIEKVFYFNKEKKNEVIQTWYSWSNDYETTNKKLFTFNLGEVNPLLFDRISILFDNEDDISTHIGFGKVGYNGEKISEYFNKHPLKEIIINKKIASENEINNDLYTLQYEEPSHLIAMNKVAISFYWENNNYFLQISLYQFAKNYIIFPQGGTLWMGIGKGIKLYNK